MSIRIQTRIIRDEDVLRCIERLVEGSCWFMVEPGPDELWIISVKDESYPLNILLEFEEDEEGMPEEFRESRHGYELFLFSTI